MSYKSKNLSYEAQEPAFLQRLRAQQAGLDTDRQERPVARPKRLRVEGDDDEDAPAYVDAESNQVISKDEYRALVKGTEHADADADAVRGEKGGDGVKVGGVDVDAEGPEGVAGARRKQDVMEVGHGLGKKRRKVLVSKAVGGDEGDAPDELEAATAEKASTGKTGKKGKKKVKPVKLSFGDAES